MIFRSLLSLLALSFAFTAAADEPREGRGMHKTKVWCTISNFKSAKDCMKRVAEAMPSENDENAAFVTASKRSKRKLIQILEHQEADRDKKYVNRAAYVGVVVQNDDEESIYYYTMKKGRGKPKLVGATIGIVDLGYDMCDDEPAYPDFMKTVRGTLLGLNPNRSVLGTVWYEDLECF